MKTGPETKQQPHPHVSSAARTVTLLAAVLLVITFIVVRGIEKGELNLEVDETIHGVTGLYFADLLTDLPLTDPVRYTYEYYAQYPALGLIHWPPFFHFTEGIVFLLLGPSVVAARLTVLLFALVGFSFWFLLVKELQDVWAAAASTLLLACLPILLLYQKAVMLEVPSLAVSLVAIYLWVRYLRTGTTKFLYWFALAASLALLTKQHTIFLAAFCLLTFLVERKWSLLWNRAMLRAVVLCVFLVVPFYVLAFSVHGQSIADHIALKPGSGPPPPWYSWVAPFRLTDYLLTLPDQLGYLLLVLALVGLGTCWWWAGRETRAVMAAWILACYLTFTFLGARDARYMIYWLPPLIYFGVSPFVWALRFPKLRLVSAGFLLLLLGGYVRSAWSFERPYVSGYAEAARYLVNMNDACIILYDGALPGNFIFHLRTFDPERRFIVLRKALYVTRIRRMFGHQELVQTAAELQELIHRYGIKYVIVTEKTPLTYEAQRLLREMLQAPPYHLVKRFPTESNTPSWQGVNLLLYENSQPQPPTAKELRIKMLTLDRDIVVPLDALRDQ